jgi:hypothetical protein
MEFDDMYEINLCNEMELNTWMKYIARKWYGKMGEVYDTNEIHKSQSHSYQLIAPKVRHPSIKSNPK